MNFTALNVNSIYSNSPLESGSAISWMFLAPLVRSTSAHQALVNMLKHISTALILIDY